METQFVDLSIYPKDILDFIQERFSEYEIVNFLIFAEFAEYIVDIIEERLYDSGIFGDGD